MKQQPIQYSKITDEPVYAEIKKRKAAEKSAYDSMFGVIREADHSEELRAAAKDRWSKKHKSFVEHLYSNRLMEDPKNPGEFYRETPYTSILKKHEPDIPPLIKRGKNAPKILKSIPYIGSALTGYAALSAPTADAAVGELLGVESMGVDADQAELDRQYRARIRKRTNNNHKNVTKLPSAAKN